ncbi:MAG TPA: DUF2867 domain-containing protein [Actinomycetota bacterium]|nr:DUF2867 domain-containing protein [Actinomycetota bacterium]
MLERVDVRLPRSEHTSQPWRIHELAPDFRVEDVWALPTPGGPDDFPRLVEGFASFDPSTSSSPAVRMLFTARRRLGELLGLDDPAAGVGERVSTLRDRLPDDLRGARPPVRFAAAPFEPVYMTGDELAAEIANRTVHGVLHLGWVEEDAGRYRGQLAILVKRNGLLGAAYMAAIKPFRHLMVYPQLMRDVERAWGQGRTPAGEGRA